MKINGKKGMKIKRDGKRRKESEEKWKGGKKETEEELKGRG